jgi:two-component system phosphate regulon sensor histidine kinase PhoR
VVNARGKAIAVLGIDMNADNYASLVQSIFSPVAFILIVCSAVLLGAFLLLWNWRRRFQMMELLDRERSSLIDLLMHQLGTPVSTFRWWTEILRDRDKNPGNDDAYAHMEDGIDRMQGILSALSEANCAATSAVPSHGERTSLGTIVERVAAQTAIRMQERAQTMSVSVEPSLPDVQLDHASVEAILHALLDNAQSYSPDGTVIRVRVFRQRKRVCLEVRDEGWGIPADELRRVTEIFRRGRDAMKYKPVGNGMGLFMVRNIVERAGGSMRIRSEVGKGTVVSRLLPAIRFS